MQVSLSAFQVTSWHGFCNFLKSSSITFGFVSVNESALTLHPFLCIWTSLISQTCHQSSVADRRTDTWFLMSSPLPQTIVIAAYIYFVTSLGPRMMQNRKAFDLKGVLIVYNFGVVALSLYMCYEVSHVLLQHKIVRSGVLLVELVLALLSLLLTEPWHMLLAVLCNTLVDWLKLFIFF